MSFLFGERALNSEVDEDPEGRSSSDDWEVDSWGGDILGGLGILDIVTVSFSAFSLFQD